MATMVLVAGSWLGGWAWERVTPHLAAAGHEAHPVTFTGLGDRTHLSSPEINLNTHVADIVFAIEYADLHDVVVAHSYAGAPTGAPWRHCRAPISPAPVIPIFRARLALRSSSSRPVTGGIAEPHRHGRQ